MIRFTTPLQEFIFDVDPDTSFSRIVISYSQRGKILIEKEKTDLVFDEVEIQGETAYVASFKMSQEETGRLSPQVPVMIQVRVLTYEDDSLASEIVRCSVEDVLKREVLEVVTS